ncbi:TetR/AcrR family transcriptional regulator [Chloroflexota bacterium]
MDGFERRKERKKESIRRAALELFRIYGFEKVSVNEIARRANVSQVTIYNHFGSREELVRDVIKTLCLNLLEKYRAIIKGEGTFPEKLERIIFDKKELLGQYQGELINNTIRNDPEMQHFIDSIWQRDINQLVIEFFDEGKRQGYVDQELSSEAILVYYEILRRGLSASSDLLKIEHDAELMHQLMSLFTYGLVGKAK